MKEIISTYREEFNTIKKRVGRTALALGFSASVLTGCSSGEEDTNLTPTPAATEIYIEPTIEPTPTEEVIKCAIYGMEELDYEDPRCIIK